MCYDSEYDFFPERMRLADNPRSPKQASMEKPQTQRAAPTRSVGVRISTADGPVAVPDSAGTALPEIHLEVGTNQPFPCLRSRHSLHALQERAQGSANQTRYADILARLIISLLLLALFALPGAAINHFRPQLQDMMSRMSDPGNLLWAVFWVSAVYVLSVFHARIEKKNPQN
jgi:hypothetical protein